MLLVRFEVYGKAGGDGVGWVMYTSSAIVVGGGWFGVLSCQSC